MTDLVIRGGTVIDGSGEGGFLATVLIRGDRIEAVIPTSAASGGQPTNLVPNVPDARVLDATGCVVAPGFIDPHQHSDCSPMVTPWMESFLRQGVTTAISGNCGLSAWPGNVAREAISATGARPEDVPVTWDTAGEYFDVLANAEPAINVASLAGHGSIREAVMGMRSGAPTRDELHAMQAVLEEALESGALGLSTGLIYAPGFHAQTDELIAMAAVMAGTGAPYASHMRNEGMLVFDAIEEASQIGERADVPVHISHLKLDVVGAWGQVDALFAALDGARARGVDISCDQYPYAAYETSLAAFLPPWAPVAELEAILAGDRERLRSAVLRGDGLWQSSVKDVGWERIFIGAHAIGSYSGKSVEEIAAAARLDPFDAMCRILQEDAACGVVGHSMSEADVADIRRNPAVMVGSDGIATAPDGPLGALQVHPRYYGTFPRVLGRAVREQGLLSLVDAVRAMTSRVADVFGLVDRGRVVPGGFADLVVFDPAGVTDTATFVAPHSYPEGIEMVIVNGAIAWTESTGYEQRAGRVLRRD